MTLRAGEASLEIDPETSVRLPDTPGGWFPSTAAVLRDGSLALVWADHDLAAGFREGYPYRENGNPYELARQSDALITTFDGDQPRVQFRFRMESPFPRVDRFRDGSWIVAEARLPEGKTNARLLDADGSLTGRIMIGDGIEHLKTDDADGIWVGWFDEGIFGNDEWRWPGEKGPPSAAGLACFERDGSLRDRADRAGVDQISDCYALNVVGRSAWFCPYTDFPIVRLEAGAQARRWTGVADGPTALAVHHDLAVLVGGYQKDHNRAVLVDLAGAEPKALLRSRLKMTAEKEQGFSLLDARGDTVHHVSSGFWHRWTVRHLKTQARR